MKLEKVDLKSPSPHCADNRRSNRVRILVADDHLVYRIGIRSLITSEPGFEVVGEVSDGAAAIEFYRRLMPDVLLLDLRMPQIGGIEVVRSIRKESPDARILIVTSYQTEEETFRVLEAGALGYIMKDLGLDLLMDAIHTVRSGNRWLPKSIQRQIADRELWGRMTEREMEVLRLLARGLTNREIASALHISSSTVKNHVKSIFTKLDVAGRTEAVSLCLSRGILLTEDL
jgi:two-component system, NarL family, response regulator